MGENQDGIRPDSVTVQLLANGTAVEGKTAVLNEANEWTDTWTRLTKNMLGAQRLSIIHCRRNSSANRLLVGCSVAEGALTVTNTIPGNHHHQR